MCGVKASVAGAATALLLGGCGPAATAGPASGGQTTGGQVSTFQFSTLSDKTAQSACETLFGKAPDAATSLGYSHSGFRWMAWYNPNDANGHGLSCILKTPDLPKQYFSGIEVHRNTSGQRAATPTPYLAINAQWMIEESCSCDASTPEVTAAGPRFKPLLDRALTRLR